MKEGIFYDFLNTAIGRITIQTSELAVTQIMLTGKPVPGIQRQTDIWKEAATELKEYLNGRRRTFDVPLEYTGTEFQMKVWASLSKIPYGEVRTYKDIAEEVGCPKGYRAVGGANHVNPIPILIPCHRVVAAGGRIGGFAENIQIKVQLLALEGREYKDKCEEVGMA